MYRSQQIDLKHLPEFTVADLIQRSRSDNTGVIDQQIQTAQCCRG